LRSPRRLACGLALGAWFAGAGWAAAASRFGVNAHTPQGEALLPLLDAVVEGRIGWLRVDVVWSEIERRPGERDWRRVDDLVVEARARGLEILGILASTPGWATDGVAGAGVPRDSEDWGRFCALAAARYAGAIDHWELWNEPNQRRFWQGSRREWIDGVLRPGAAAVRAGNPAARVVGPALAHVGGEDGADWASWLLAVLREAGGELDVVSHHVYGASDEEVSARLGSRTEFGEEPALWGLAAPSVREVLAAGGWSGPFWLTETGWQAQGTAELFQAAKYWGLLEEWFTGRRGRGWIERIFFYELQDDERTRWGILRADRSRKPAWIVYREFIAVQSRPPAPQSPSRPVDKAPRRVHPKRGS
jgi:hypothetical protein